MNTKDKICCIFNYASHYREEIYRKMEDELDVDLYFGDIENGSIKKIDYSVFKKKVIESHTVRLYSHFVWIKDTVKLVFRPYNKYILTGEPYCISTWLILIFNKIAGKETYLWTHGWYGDERGIKRGIKKAYYSLATKLLLYGEYAQKLMIKEGFNIDRLEVFYNSLEYETQRSIRNTLLKTDVFKEIFKNDDPVIMFTGRLTPVKKLDQLLKALKELKEKNIAVNVFILGDGAEKGGLQKLAKELGVDDKVYFYGVCYDEKKIAEFYYNARVCVSPGNVGLTGIHAMTYGCPVISHNNFVEQMPEFEVIQDGKTGFFFQQNNEGDLVEKIKQIFILNENELKQNCFAVIDSKFNTRYQINLLKRL